MTKRLALAILAVSLLGGLARAEESEAQRHAVAAANAWLAQTDAGQYGASWDSASSLFQRAVTKADWEKAVRATRAPLGAATSRKLRTAEETHSLPGAPDGDYVVLTYDTSFENKASAVETVTPMREKDGTWKVSGYFIH